MSAELDYAFLADYARADGGTITAVGASFTQAEASKFPTQLTISIAGRVRRLEDDEDPTVGLTITPPGGSPVMSMEFEITSDDDAVVYDGKVANVFAVRGPVICNDPGLCEVNITVNGEQARRLAFEVMDASA